jgi:hypothetical protein
VFSSKNFKRLKKSFDISMTKIGADRSQKNGQLNKNVVKMIIVWSKFG